MNVYQILQQFRIDLLLLFQDKRSKSIQDLDPEC